MDGNGKLTEHSTCSVKACFGRKGKSEL